VHGLLITALSHDGQRGSGIGGGWGHGRNRRN
jgi:hypothetical protein